MRRIKVVNKTGLVHDTELIDLETGENLCRRYGVSSINIVLDVNDDDLRARAVVEFTDIELDVISNEVETNHQIIKGAL